MAVEHSTTQKTADVIKFTITDPAKRCEMAILLLPRSMAKGNATTTRTTPLGHVFRRLFKYNNIGTATTDMALLRQQQ